MLLLGLSLDSQVYKRANTMRRWLEKIIEVLDEYVLGQWRIFV